MSRPAPRPRAHRPALFNFAPPVNQVPVIQLFGDIGASEEEDWFWGDEGGAGTFKEFCAKLAALGNVDELRVEIHSYGGDVCVGKAIHDKLAEHPAAKTAVIYGVCASAATYPALACQSIQIPANSFFLIHNSTGICLGEAADMRRSAENLDICDDSIANLYAARTGKSVEEIRTIMDADTWMNGTDAVEMGLATEVIDPITVDPAAKISPDNFRNEAIGTMPRAARVWFDTRRSNSSKHFLNHRNSNPPTVMTEAELKAAELKLKNDQAAFENTKKEADAAALKIKNDAQLEADRILAEAKKKAGEPEPPKNVITLESLAADNKAQAEELKNLKLKIEQGVVPGALPGAKPAENIVTPGTVNGQQTMKHEDWNKLPPLEKQNFFRNGGKLV